MHLLQVRREARQRAYERALGETMHSGEQAAIQGCLELLRQADSMEVGGAAGGCCSWGGWQAGWWLDGWMAGNLGSHVVPPAAASGCLAPPA